MNRDRTSSVFGAWSVRVKRRLDVDQLFLVRNSREAVVQWRGSPVPDLRFYVYYPYHPSGKSLQQLWSQGLVMGLI